MITYEIIKKMIEKESMIEDLAIESRERVYIHLRSVYYKLCYIFHPEFTQQDCANLMGFTHDMVSYHLKDFNNLFNHHTFDYRNLYHDLYFNLSKIYKNESIRLVKPVTLWSKFKLMEIINNKTLKINKQHKQIKKLEADVKELVSQMEVIYQVA